MYKLIISNFVFPSHRKAIEHFPKTTMNALSHLFFWRETCYTGRSLHRNHIREGGFAPCPAPKGMLLNIVFMISRWICRCSHCRVNSGAYRISPPPGCTSITAWRSAFVSPTAAISGLRRRSCPSAPEISSSSPGMCPTRPAPPRAAGACGPIFSWIWTCWHVPPLMQPSLLPDSPPSGPASISSSTRAICLPAWASWPTVCWRKPSTPRRKPPTYCGYTLWP